MAWSAPVPGSLYRVTLQDCGIDGEFTARLISGVATYEDDPNAEPDAEAEGWSGVYTFDNGVTLTIIGQVTFELAE